MNLHMMVPFSTRHAPTNMGDPFVLMHRQMNRAFDELLGALPQSTQTMPFKLDFKEDESTYYVTAELPGMDEKDVEVTFNDGLLSIHGERKIERDEKKDTWHMIERSSGSFSRQLSLPADVQVDNINAKFEKGVLNITLPKAPNEKGKMKKIEIKTG